MSGKIRKIAVLTSGGDSPGMNPAIRAVVRASVYYKKEVVGVFRGYDGLVEGDFIELDARGVKNILHRGGTFLKSARSESFRTPEGRQQAAQQMKDRGIDALVVIGGDGSFTGAKIFEAETGIKTIGIPGTIDNDLAGTDYTLGFDTALNTVVEAVDKIRDTAHSHNRLFFVEVMGRDTGFIALQSGLAIGALDMVLPEEHQSSWDELTQYLEKAFEAQKTSNIVMVAEGSKVGDAYSIAERAKQLYPNIDTKVTVLGHLQRGGAPSCKDRVLASLLGVSSVEHLLNGKSGGMVGEICGKVVFTPFEEAIGKKKKLDTQLLKIGRILSI